MEHIVGRSWKSRGNLSYVCEWDGWIFLAQICIEIKIEIDYVLCKLWQAMFNVSISMNDSMFCLALNYSTFNESEEAERARTVLRR